MDALLAVLRQLADGARGPLVHALIDELEAALAAQAPQAPAPAPIGPPAAIA